MMQAKNLLFLTLLSVLFISRPAFSQVDECKWTFSVEVTSETEAVLVFKAKVAEGWHLYSQEYSLNPLLFAFEKSGSYEAVGKVKEPAVKRVYDEYLEADQVYFASSSVKFTQKIKIKSDKPFEVKGEITAQVCLENGVCKPFVQPFAFKVDPSLVGTSADDTDGDGVKNEVDACPDEAGFSYTNGCPDGDSDSIPDNTDKCPTAAGPAAKGGCPDTDGDGITDDADRCPGVAGKGADGCPAKDEAVNTITKHVPQELSEENLEKLEAGCGEGVYKKKDKSFWGIFIGGFLGGLLALLTPCVFPMIPLTVSFFTKQSKSRAKGIRNAFTYGLSIIFIYTFVGFLITKIAGPDALNAMSTDAFWNILFFVVFVVFAVSFFGAFEITLPSRFVNAVDKQSYRAGLIGIFFMAFTLSLVSFSCTGPIIGTLLVKAAESGSAIGPLTGMFGFSLALALPFGLFAAFPGWLNSLPKSGSWMETVKKSLGFLELALALKFFSTVDLAYHWGILKIEIFLGAWVLIFLLWTLYAFGILEWIFKKKKVKMDVLRVVLGLATLGFTGYLVSGLAGNNLTLLSGLAPPRHYSIFNDGGVTCPLGIDCYHDFDEGMEVAKAQNKPVMIDFTGHGCVNCRKMEEIVWPELGIKDMIKNDYVLISLYVDDKPLLPEDEQPLSPTTGEKLTSVGEKWSAFQRYYFHNQSQPQYILIDHEGRLLADEGGYTDKETFKKFLEEGLCRFNLRYGKK